MWAIFLSFSFVMLLHWTRTPTIIPQECISSPSCDWFTHLRDINYCLFHSACYANTTFIDDLSGEGAAECQDTPMTSTTMASSSTSYGSSSSTDDLGTSTMTTSMESTTMTTAMETTTETTSLGAPECGIPGICLSPWHQDLSRYNTAQECLEVRESLNFLNIRKSVQYNHCKKREITIIFHANWRFSSEFAQNSSIQSIQSLSTTPMSLNN